MYRLTKSGEKVPRDAGFQKVFLFSAADGCHIAASFCTESAQLECTRTPDIQGDQYLQLG